MNRREMLYLGLPFLLIGIGGVILTAREKKRIERESGPLRTEITDIRFEDVTPFEAWQGFSHKVTVSTELQGDQSLPEGFKLRGNTNLSSDAQLIVENGEHSEIINLGNRDYDDSNIKTLNAPPLVAIPNWDAGRIYGFRTFLIKTNNFGNARLRLQGTVRLQQQAIVSANHEIPQGAWTLQRSYYKSASQVSRSTPAVPFEILLPPRIPTTTPKSTIKVIEAGKSSFSPQSEKTGPYEGEGETQIRVKFKVPEEFMTNSSNIGTRLSTGPTDILDKNNRPVKLPKKRYGSDPTIRFTSSNIFLYVNGEGVAKRNIPVWNIPASYGPLTYRTWLSYSGSSPVELKIPVRTADDLKPSYLLKLESVKVVTGNVRVRVKYLGPSEVEWEDNNGFFNNRPFNNDFVPFQLNNVGEPLKDKLISNWSQHLTASNGKEYWFKNAVKVQSVNEVAPSVYEIVYATNALSALKKGETMKFSAHVGIEGDGFIPIEAKITKK
jgi:hypothetical protein